MVSFGLGYHVVLRLKCFCDTGAMTVLVGCVQHYVDDDILALGEHTGRVISLVVVYSNPFIEIAVGWITRVKQKQTIWMSE